MTQSPLPPEPMSPPYRWQDAFVSQLQTGERMIVSALLDLSTARSYEPSGLVLTNQRLVHVTATGGIAQQWGLHKSLTLSSQIQAGLGLLELRDDGRRVVGKWHFTANVGTQLDRLVALFRSVVEHASWNDEKLLLQEQQVCPSCGAPLPADDTTCRTCTPTAAPPPSRSLLRLVPFAQHRQGTIIWGLVLAMAATVAGLIPPYLSMPLLDKVLIPWQSGAEVSSWRVAIYLSGLAVAALLTWGLSWARTFVLSLASEQISADLRNKTYAHLQSLSLEFYGGRRTGDLISRISNDTERICNFLSIHLVDFLTDVLMFVFTSIVLISIDPVLAAATLLPFPAIAWLVQQVRIHLRHGFARAGHAWSDMVSVLTDAIPGVRVVKAFAQESREIERFQQVNHHVFESNVRVNRLWAFFGPTVTLLTELGILIIWGFGVWRVASGHITVGTLTMFLAYISRFYIRLDSMSRMLANTQRAASATYRIFEILDRQPTVMEPVHPVHPGRLQGSLQLRDVTFKYGNRHVLQGIDLDIEPGELIGLVGPSGSGKSTLVNLVCRFYDPTQGAILADGNDIRAFPLEEFRSNIGIVLQEPYLFYGTIADNISYGRPHATRAEVIASARAARAHHFILKLPDGYDSIVGERGQGLSGGERQRISIARALLTDPRILILDEATSAVDNETEREIQAALDNLIRGRTTIAIAHRLSTLRNADRIVVLENGRIAEVDDHDGLLRRGGVYARLYEAQLEKQIPEVSLTELAP